MIYQDDELFGIRDVEDECWMGNDRGPLTYTDYQDAVLATQILSVRLQISPTRLQVMEIDPYDLHKKDEIETKYNAEEALWRLEEGYEI